jgi:hypothetical protein
LVVAPEKVDRFSCGVEKIENGSVYAPLRGNTDAGNIGRSRCAHIGRTVSDYDRFSR